MNSNQNLSIGLARCLRAAFSFVSLIAMFAFGLALGVSPASGQQPPASTGVIEGRVSNAATGAVLGNARVTLDDTGLEITTDGDGRFRIRGVAPGRVTVAVHYVGYDRKAVSVEVVPNGVARADVELSLSDRAGAVSGDTPVALSAFTVVEQREITAQAVAMNEQRMAPNIKNVVALDEYGDLGQENVGDFLRFLPGITIGSAGLTASEISVRGLPSDTTQLMIDGNLVQGAETGRVVPPHVVSLGNVSRVEVTKVPTPDSPASGLGGTVNLMRRSAFERKKPVFTYQIYQLLNTDSGVTFGGGPPGMLPGVSPGYNKPSWSFSYLNPLTENFGVSASGGFTWRKQGLRGRNQTPTWNLVNRFQRQSQHTHIRSIVDTTTAQAGFDWRIKQRHTLYFNYEYKDRWVMVPRDQLVINFGAGATGDASHTQGAATGVGTVTMGGGANQKTTNHNRTTSLRYVFRHDDWEITASAARSSFSLRAQDLENGHLNNVSATLSNLIIRGDGIGVDGSAIPTRFSAVDRAGQAVGIYDGTNYVIDSASSAKRDTENDTLQARIDVKKDFDRLSLRLGTRFNRQDRDHRSKSRTFTFRPNGSAAAADRLAGRFDVFDPVYNATTQTLGGVPVNWISVRKSYELFEQRPDWWVENLATSHTNQVNDSTRLVEEISAFYLRTDFRTLSNKLWLVAGVRYEGTMTEGWGRLNDPNARYVKNANGEIVRNSAGQPVFISADPLVRARQQFQERGAYNKRRYDGYYPSFNATYNLTDNLLLRAGYARTIGRPNLTFIIPGTNIPEEDAPSPRTFSAVNTALKPWTGDNYDLSLESYQIKGGFGSVSVFQKDIKNFFNLVTTELTPEIAADYGIPAGSFDPGDLLSTRTNGGDATIRGVEFMYRQRLLFLPWSFARSFQIFANANKLKLSGERTADFGSYTPSNYAWGVSLIRPKYSIKFTSSHQGQIRRGLQAVSAANGIPADTYNYDGKRERLSLSAEYSFTKFFSVFSSWTNIGGLDVVNLRYAPDTPGYARPTSFGELGSLLTLGIKGEF